MNSRIFYKATRLLAHVTLVAMIAAAPLALASESQVQKQLNDLCNGNHLTLRQPDAAKIIVFDAQGLRVGTPAPGPWYENVRFVCSRMKLKHDELVIDGKRVIVSFVPDEGKFVNMATKEDVRMKIGLSAPANEMTALTPVLNRVFLSSKETLADVAPEAWETCLRGEVKKNGVCVWPEHPVWNGHGPGEHPHITVPPPVSKEHGPQDKPKITPPKSTYAPDPEYTQLALSAKVNGSTLLWFVLDKDGIPHHIRIERPLGFGLDDAAVEKVKTWRFKAATKNGEPMETVLEVEVNFKRYPANPVPADSR